MERPERIEVFVDTTASYALIRQPSESGVWYVEDSYRKLRDRNLLLRALHAGAIAPEGLSIDDLRSRLLIQWWTAYSAGYALLLGAAEQLGVPDTDLNVTIAGVDATATVASTTASIVLYDNVPGGAGLVAQLERKDVFTAVLRHARDRVSGGCGCDSSCYGCLRSYRNQFAHPHLDRTDVLENIDQLHGIVNGTDH